MNKGDVLRVEFEPIFDMWGMKIVYQNTDVLRRDIFRDDGLRIYSGGMTEYLKNKDLYIWGRDEKQDNNILLVPKEDKSELEKRIELLNKAYGLYVKDRLSIGEIYYFVTSDFTVNKDIDFYNGIHNERYKNGNYFTSFSSALDYAEYMRECSLKYIK